MAAQSGTDGASKATREASYAASSEEQSSASGASVDVRSAHSTISPEAASAASIATHQSAKSAPRQSQPARESLFARWFGAPFMPCFLGLAALRIWLQVNQFGGYAQSDNGIVTILSNLTYGLTFLIAAAVAWRKPPTPRTECTLAFVAAALMLIAPLLMLDGLSPNSGNIATAGALLVGVAGAFGGGMWACAYTRLPLKPALMYAFASLALGSLGGLAVSFLPEGSRYIASLFMPAVSILCFERARTYTGDAPLGGVEASERADAASAAETRQDAIGETIAGASTLPAAAARLALTGSAFPTMHFGKATVHPYDNEPKLSLALIIGGIAVFGLALGLSRGFPAGSPVPFGLPVRLVHQLGVVAISCGFLWWIGAKGRRISFSLLWRLEIVIAAAGAFVLMTMPGTATEIAVAIINIADTLMLCVLFITAQDVTRHSSLHPFVIFGGAWAARVLSRDFGRTIVFALSPMTQSESAVLGIIVFALSLSMVCLLSDNLPRTRKLFTYDDEPSIPMTSGNASCESIAPSAIASETTPTPEADGSATQPEAPVAPSAIEAETAGMPETDSPATQPSKPQINPDDRTREWLRTEHGLTAREIDVALLIAHGRSKTFIANELFISENTVRTHSKNVYAKLGIHSREELISLFENRMHA